MKKFVKINLYACVPGLGDCIFPIEDLAEIKKDQTAYFAEAAGVSKADYIGYLTDDSIRCEHRNRRGKRCKMEHRDSGRMRIDQWANFKDGWYCRFHGEA